jgi:hypothetical protein
LGADSIQDEREELGAAASPDDQEPEWDEAHPSGGGD